MKNGETLNRCGWARNELSIAYHDAEWGVPVRDDRTLFEFLILEGAQAGLSWDTILRKREHYRTVFDNFDAAKVALYDEAKVAELLQDAGIIRNRLKIVVAITNAQKFLTVQAEFGSFDAYIWQFVKWRQRWNYWQEMSEVPAQTPQSDAMSKDLQRRGFKFVGSTICYAFMQATGMVNDHLADCFRHNEVKWLRVLSTEAMPAEYFFKKYRKLMTQDEILTYYYFANARVKNEVSLGVQILPFVREGEDIFKRKLIERLKRDYPNKAIMQEYLNEGVVNRCPKCNAVTRTAKARQCPKCFYSWHEVSA